MVQSDQRAAGLDHQMQLVVGAGLSPSTVPKIEQGRRNVSTKMLWPVTDALERLGVDVTQNGRTRSHAVGPGLSHMTFEGEGCWRSRGWPLNAGFSVEALPCKGLSPVLPRS